MLVYHRSNYMINCEEPRRNTSIANKRIFSLLSEKSRELTAREKEQLWICIHSLSAGSFFPVHSSSQTADFLQLLKDIWKPRNFLREAIFLWMANCFPVRPCLNQDTQIG